MVCQPQTLTYPLCSLCHTNCHCLSIKWCLYPLYLAGDMELSPGPASYPCGVCQQAVRSNQRGILCEACYKWLHTKDVFTLHQKSNRIRTGLKPDRGNVHSMHIDCVHTTFLAQPHVYSPPTTRLLSAYERGMTVMHALFS